MNYDQEFTAMRTILKALDRLDDDAKLRVMRYITEVQDAAINNDNELDRIVEEVSVD